MSQVSDGPGGSNSSTGYDQYSGIGEAEHYIKTYYTLRDYWNDNPPSPLGFGDTEFRIGPYTLLLPPDAISVDQSYAPITSFGATIRQPNNAKMASGRLIQGVTFSFIAPQQGTGSDLYTGSLLDLIVLFKGMPFCPVQNTYLNDVFGIQALSFEEWSVETIQGFPGSFRVSVACQDFNWRCYLDSEDFASQIDYDKLKVYLERGRRLYMEQAAMDLTSYMYGNPETPNTTGENAHGVFNNAEFDLLFPTASSVSISIDLKNIAMGDSYLVVKQFLADQGKIIQEDNSTDWSSIMDYIKSFGWDSESSILGSQGGLEGLGTPQWLHTMDLINFIVEKTDQRKLNALAAQFKAENQYLSDTAAKEMAATYMAQIGFKALEDIARNNGAPIHTDTVPWGQDESQIVLEGLDLSEAVTVSGISVRSKNCIAHLPLQLAEGHAMQYMGADDTYVRLDILCVGDYADSDLAKIASAFRTTQAMVRATRSQVSAGFIGIRSPLTALCGVYRFLPSSMRIQNLQGYPHNYLVSIDLVSFDIWQQDREKLMHVVNNSEMKERWKGHPSLRIEDQSTIFNLYPDLYLERDENGDWEHPDYYFIATPDWTPSKIVDNTGLTFAGQPEGTDVSMVFGKDGCNLTVKDAKGETHVLNMDNTIGDFLKPTLSDGTTPVPSNTPQQNSDINFGANLAEMYDKYCSSNLNGHMRRAFPTFFFSLVDEPRNFLMYRTYTDFYGRRGISSIVINRSVDPMQEVAMVQLTDIYRRLSFDSTPHSDSSIQDQAWWASTIYNDTKMLFQKLGADIPIESVVMQPGMRVHIRMGYCNDIKQMDTIFNGTVTEVQPSSDGVNMTVVAQGDGRELLGVINVTDKSSDTADISGLFYSEPRELVIRLLSMRSSIWHNALALMSRGAFHPDPKNGIRHFGELLPVTVSSETPNLRDKMVELEAEKKNFITGNLFLMGNETTKMKQYFMTGSTTDPNGEMNFEGVEAKDVEVTMDNYSLLDAVATAILGLWAGWDQNIFSRNVYPGTASGLLENSTPGTGVSDWVTTGGGGGSLWEQIKYAIGDTFDFYHAQDEPSFKAYCTRVETECLSKTKGWVFYNELAIGDEIATLNIDTGKCEWKPVRFVYSSEYDGELDVIANGKGFLAEVTPGHKWPVQTHHRSPRTLGKRIYSGNFVMREDIHHVSHNERLALARECSTLPAQPIETDSFVELVGWFCTEGWIQKDQRKSYVGVKFRPTVFICQSNIANPEKVTRIRSMLQGIAHYESPQREDGYISWSINKYTSEAVLMCVDEDDKSPTMGFINSLTEDQLQLLYDVVHLGDGSYNGPKPYEQKVLVQKSEKWLDRIQMVATLLGIATHQRRRQDNPEIGVLSSLKQNYKNRHQLKVTKEHYKGIVWCPNTENGTFVARRNGYVFITGNTFMRTTWDLIQQASDLVPNYIVAVRPFMHRSTLFMGKPFWKYTSGVRSYLKDGEIPTQSTENMITMPDINKVVTSMGYYQVRIFVKGQKVNTTAVVVQPSGDSIGIVPNVSGDAQRYMWFNDYGSAALPNWGPTWDDRVNNRTAKACIGNQMSGAGPWTGPALAKKGRKFVVLYFGHEDGSAKFGQGTAAGRKKTIEMCVKSGIAICFVYEYKDTREYIIDGGFKQGVHDATMGYLGMLEVGVPYQSRPLYFAFDVGVTPQEAEPYMKGVMSVAGDPSLIGVYGPYDICKWMVEKGYAGWSWQWSGSSASTRPAGAPKYWEGNNLVSHGGWKTEGGNETPEDLAASHLFSPVGVEACTPDYGQWTPGMKGYMVVGGTTTKVVPKITAADDNAKWKISVDKITALKGTTNFQKLNQDLNPELWQAVQDILKDEVMGAAKSTEVVGRDADNYGTFFSNIFRYETNPIWLNWNNDDNDGPFFEAQWSIYGHTVLTGMDRSLQRASPKQLLRANDAWNQLVTQGFFPDIGKYFEEVFKDWDGYYFPISGDKMADKGIHLNNSVIVEYCQASMVADVYPQLRKFMLEGAGFQILCRMMEYRSATPPPEGGQVQEGESWADWNRRYIDSVGGNGVELNTAIAEVMTIGFLEGALKHGWKFIPRLDDNKVFTGTLVAGPSGTTGPDWNDWAANWWLDTDSQVAMKLVCDNPDNALGDAVADLPAVQILGATVQFIGELLATGFKMLYDFAKGVIELAAGSITQLFSYVKMADYIHDFSRIMSDAVYTNDYTWVNDGTMRANPFCREFGEPVAEVREVFSRFHKIDSLRNIIANNISCSDADVYPVVTSVSKGGKPKTVYADKSIATEFQKELVYENNLNYDILNFRDGIHAKRIGLAACARSLRTMYQGSISILGDCTYQPWDTLYIADVVTDLWGTCQVKEVTQVLDAQMGFVTQIAVQPIVAVDDPAQWAVSTVLSGFMQRWSYDTTTSKKYYGDDEVQKMMEWYNNDPDRQTPLSWQIGVGAGMGLMVVLFVLGTALTGGALPVALTGTMAATGLGGILNGEMMSALPRYFDEQQDVWIQLLIRRGEPFQAGLTGATGIVVGRQKSVGIDFLDMFSTDRPILGEEELYRRMGLTDSTLVQWELDIQKFRTRALLDVMQEEWVESIWNPPEGGYERVHVTVSTIIDGDTFYAWNDDHTHEYKVRMAGYDSPEVEKNPDGTPDFSKENDDLWAKGIAATRALIAMMPVGSGVTLYIHPKYQQDDFGRDLAFVITDNGVNVANEMITNNLGQLWGRSENVR
jgi:endonuclease YncB( thermonuclease family)